MPSVGPQLPPHLAKRKRSIDDYDHPKSPPRKVQAATAPQPLGPTLPPSKNSDELKVDSDSEDDFGPTAQISKGPSLPPKRTLGPTLPPSKGPSPPPKRVSGPTLPPSQNPDELDVEASSSEDDYGPSLQPKKPSPPPKRRVLGPAPPPAPLSEMPSHPADDSSSDSEDDYGPSLPPAPGSAAEAALLQSQRLEREQQTSTSSEPAKPKREEWMLVPPTASSWADNIDPTKLKNRKFASGKGSRAPGEKTGVSSIWTETPDEKRKRLADEVLGRVDPSTSSKGSKSNLTTREMREEEATARRISEYNEKNRGKSLYAQREEGKAREGKKEEEDDPSKRGFDREKDMALGGTIGNAQKREMLAKAKDFGSRFQKGKYL